jgi:hypothetical protein
MGDHDTRNDFLLWVELIMVLGNKAFTVLKWSTVWNLLIIVFFFFLIFHLMLWV